MNLLAGHSTMLLTELSASSAHCLSAHSFRELTTQRASKATQTQAFEGLALGF